MRTVLDTVNKTRDNVTAVKSKLQRKEDIDITEWLTSVDYGHQQSEFIRKRQGGTGQWLLDSEEFETWLQEENQTLFCPGIPGAGKTILSSIVIDSLCERFQDTDNVGIAYIYCNFREQDKQKSHEMLASLLKQLAQGQPTLSGDLRSLYHKHRGRNSRPSLEDISTVLESVVKVYNRGFIILDALDECEMFGEVQKFLQLLFKLQAKEGINLMATSRFIPHIEDQFKHSVTLEIRASDDDVKRYLNSRIDLLPSFIRQKPDLKERIQSEISESAEGM